MCIILYYKLPSVSLLSLPFVPAPLVYYSAVTATMTGPIDSQPSDRDVEFCTLGMFILGMIQIP